MFPLIIQTLFFFKFSFLQFLIDPSRGIAAGSDSWMLIAVDMMKWKDHWVAPQSVSGCGLSVKCLWGNTGEFNHSPVSFLLTPQMQHSHWMPSPSSLPFSLPLSVNRLRSMPFPPFCNRGGVHGAHRFFRALIHFPTAHLSIYHASFSACATSH